LKLVFAALLLLLGIIPILLTERQRRLGKDLLHGGPELIGLDAWCERHLRIWWVARAGLVVSIVALGLRLGRATAFTMLIIIFGWIIWQHIAQMLGLNWAGTGYLNAYYKRIKKLQEDPHFRYLQDKNETLEMAFHFWMIFGLVSPILLASYFELYDRYDWHLMWLLPLGFGLMVSLPMLFVCICTLSQGWGRFREFIEYQQLKDPGSWRGWRWIVVAFALLTLVSAVMIARTGSF
jgi:hypothetical protein